MRGLTLPLVEGLSYGIEHTDSQLIQNHQGE